MRDVLLTVLLGAAAAAGAPPMVRWLLPGVLRTCLALVEMVLEVAVACLLLPDLWASSAARRQRRRPPGWAYGYGYAVADAGGVIVLALRRLVRGGITVAATTTPAVVSVVAALLTLALAVAA